MNSLSDSMKQVVDALREYAITNLREPAQEGVDRSLAHFGYTRGPSTATLVATHIATFGVGFLAGAGVGVLFAPADGSSTRERIRDRMRSAKEEAGEKVRETYEKVHDRVASDPIGGNGNPKSPASASKSGTSSSTPSTSSSSKGT